MLSTPMHRLITVGVLVVTVALSIIAIPAVSTALAASSRPQEYLALGDSVAFGTYYTTDPTVLSNANNFVGYPTPAATALKETLTDAACPGETSSDFITLGVNDYGCQAYRDTFPLHVSYNTSQLDYADAFLQSHPKTLVVSINLGSNDLYRLLNVTCQGDVNCAVAALPGMLATFSTNLDTIYGHIRTSDGYQHKIVALTYYSPNYTDVITTTAIQQLNAVVTKRTQAWGGIVADGFGAFDQAVQSSGGDPCVAGLLYVLQETPLRCDVHPSAAGRALLAQTIVNALRTD